MISTAAVLAALLTVSCTKDLQENAPVSGKDSDKVTLLIAADEVTKTTFGVNCYEVKWEKDDQIGIFIASSSTNVPASLTRDKAGKAYFKAEVSNYNEGDPLCAYYPYAANPKADASKFTLKVPYIQTQAEANKFNGANNPMIAVPVALPSAENVTDGTVVIQEQLKFRHVGAILEFDITGVPATEKLKSVQFVSSNGFPATDNSIYDLKSVTEDGDVNTVAGTYYKSVTVSLKDGGFTSGQSAKVYMTLVPGTYNGNIYISTDKNLYRYSDKTIDADRAVVKTIKADLSSSSADKSKEIKSALDYEVFAMAVNSGDYSAWVDGDGEVKLGEDITTPTYFTRIQKDWTGKFNGQKHTIKQDASVVPLFTVISEGASVSKLVLEGSKKSMANAGGYGSAAVAQINKGTIEDVTNKMVTNLKVTKGSAIAGMVKCNGGIMRNCVQEGNITIDAVIKATTTLYVGGIAAFASDAEEVSTSKAVGRFENCTNAAEINVSRTSTQVAALAKFAIGGICAVVHAGTAQKFSKFENCSNFGHIARIDKSLSDNNPGSSAPIGGIVGRVADISGIYVKVGTPGFYVEISDCKNEGNIENSSWLFNGWNGETTTGARMGEAGGIVGYVCGLAASPAKITNCTSNCTIKGGDAKGSIILGGIAGMCSYTVISDCTSTVSFEDSSRSDLTLLKTGAVGGIVGYVRNNSTIKGGFVDAKINMPATIVSQFGICTAGSYNKDNQSVTISGTKVCGSVVYQGLTEPIIVDDRNLKTYLSSFGTCNDDSVTYWTK